MKYWRIASKVDAKAVRIVQAKSRAAAIAHVYADQWQAPTRATVEDVAQAASNGVKPEVASDAGTEG